MEREYQQNFSHRNASMFDVDLRQRKAITMVGVLDDYFTCSLQTLTLLNVGGSTGIIDAYLAQYFRHVTGIDIDEDAIGFAKEKYKKSNLAFEIGDAMNLRFRENYFDVVVFSQVYEHVPDSQVAIDEIYRVLKPGGVCYFAANNRLMFMEPHYNLPLLSVLPGFLSNHYLKLTGKGNKYYEKHLTLWELKRLGRSFQRIDYTKKILHDPVKFHADYMIKPGSIRAKLAGFVVDYLYWLVPGYIWLLKKPFQ